MSLSIQQAEDWWTDRKCAFGLVTAPAYTSVIDLATLAWWGQQASKVSWSTRKCDYYQHCTVLLADELARYFARVLWTTTIYYIPC